MQENKMAAQVDALELDLFAEEVEERSNALAASTIFCLSTEGCICCFSSYQAFA